LSGGTIAAISASVNKCSISGTLTKTGAPSSGRVTSDTVTFSVPVGNTGQIDFVNFIDVGTIGYESSKNGGAFSALTDGASITFASGDTLAVRITGASAGESGTFTVRDYITQQNIGTYVITAS